MQLLGALLYFRPGIAVEWNRLDQVTRRRHLLTISLPTCKSRFTLSLPKVGVVRKLSQLIHKQAACIRLGEMDTWPSLHTAVELWNVETTGKYIGVTEPEESTAVVRRDRRHQVERSEGISVDHGLATQLPE